MSQPVDEIQPNNGKSHLNSNEERANAVEKVRTAGTLSISPELFEKVYLSPKNKVEGNVCSTFGNPTPIALGGFLLSLSSISNVLLGWQGSSLLGAAEVGVYYFFGGLLMVVGGMLELFLGNTFSSVVFTTFGAFWLTLAATFTPYFNASIAYQPTNPTTSAANPEFTTTFAFFFVYMGLLCLIYLVCALRTNLVFVLIFFLLVPTFCCLAGSFWQVHNGNTTLATRLQRVAGGLAFAVSLLGWYLFTVQMLAAVDFPVNLPVADLSRYIRGASEVEDKKQSAEAA